MPLTKREIDALLKDLLKYKDELKWTEADIERIKKAGKKEDVEWLEKRKAEAQKRRDAIEKVIVARFPSKFGKPRAEKKEAEVKPKEVVVPAEEPEVLEIRKGVLERINDTLALQADCFHAFEGIAKEQLESFNTIKEIAEEEKAIKENYSEITYPAGGGEVLIPAGETVLDLWTGDVYLGDGTSGILSDSLYRLGQLYARSIFIDTKKRFSVQLDGKSKHTVAADDFFARKGIQCQRVSIEVTEATSLKFWASTNPDATLEETRRTVITGEEVWGWFTTFYVAESSYISLSVYNVPANKRLMIDTISMTCPKSCIQLLEFCVSTPGKEDYWRRREYDIQGLFEFDHLVLTAHQTLTVRCYNYAGETLMFSVELLGVSETV